MKQCHNLEIVAASNNFSSNGIDVNIGRGVTGVRLEVGLMIRGLMILGRNVAVDIVSMIHQYYYVYFFIYIYISCDVICW